MSFVNPVLTKYTLGALAAAAAVLAGCGANQPERAPAATRAASTSPQPQVANGPTAAPAHAAPCRTGITASLAAPQANDPGVSTFVLRLTNTSGAPCTLHGYPTAAFLSGGSTLPVTMDDGGQYHGMAGTPRDVPLPAGGSAIALVAKFRCKNGYLTHADALRVTAPGLAQPQTLSLAGQPAAGECKKFAYPDADINANFAELSPVRATP